MRLLPVTMVGLSLSLLACGPGASSPGVKVVRLDDTELCFPATYSPDTSFMDALLAPVADQLDSSEGSELIYIPAHEIEAKVPGFASHYIGGNGVTVAHTLFGIAYAVSTVTVPGGLAARAWNIHRDGDAAFVEGDAGSHFYRVYPHPKPLFVWHLVRTPPPSDPAGLPPDGWYIGYCLEGAGGIDCTQEARFASVLYEYNIPQQDLSIRHDIQAAVEALLQEWHQNCAS